MSQPIYNSYLDQIAPYIGGKSNLQGISKIIKLSSNENAWGASPTAIEAYKYAAEKIYRYPDGSSTALTKAIANYHKIDTDKIVCGAGSDDIINLLIQAYADKDDDVLYSEHGFLMYKISTLIKGANPIVVKEVNLTTSVDNFIKAVTPKTKLIFIANPNNPTGTYISETEIRRLIANIPSHIVVVLDGAYAEFVQQDDYTDGINLVHEFDNVVVTRTFSKLYGLGGLRVGWGYCPISIANILHRIRSPFNVSHAAQAAAAASFDNPQWIKDIIQKTCQQRQVVTSAFSNMNIKVTPSEGNFILAHFDEGVSPKLDAFLQQNGILIRRMESYQLPHALRITIGTEEENQILIKHIKQFMQMELD